MSERWENRLGLALVGLFAVTIEIDLAAADGLLHIPS